jgi:hypothetical protein
MAVAAAVLAALPAMRAAPANARQPRRCADACVFVLQRGRFETIDVPVQEFVRFNNRGDIVSSYLPENPPNELVDYRGLFRDRRGRIDGRAHSGDRRAAHLPLHREC